MAIKSGKRLIITAAIVLLLRAGGLYASPLLISSPQKDATAGRFGSAADSFLSARDYAGVEFDTMFSVISFSTNYSTRDRGKFSFTEMAQIGAASRFGSLYVGLYYGGNAWKNLGMTSGGNVYDYTEQKVNFFSTEKMLRVYSSFPEYETTGNYLIYNEFALLLGISGLMGIRFSYNSNHQSFKLTEDFGVQQGGTLNFYKNFQTDYGYINPELVWAMSQDLVPGKGIKPEVKIDLDIFRNYRKREAYTAAGKTNGEYLDLSTNNTTLGIGLGLGGYTLQEVNAFKLAADFDYSLKVQTWNNEYRYQDAGGRFQIGKIKGEHGVGGLYERGPKTTHYITPSLRASWTGDNLNLSSRLKLDMTAGTSTESVMVLKTGSSDGTLVKQGSDNTITEFILAPAFDAGMQWAVVSGKLFLNAGCAIQFGGPTLKTTETKTYSQGVENTAATKLTGNTFKGASTALSLGFTFYPVRNVAVQAVCGVDTGNRINLFHIDPQKGFVNYSNLLMTVQF